MGKKGRVRSPFFISKDQITKHLSRFIQFNSVCTKSNRTFAREIGRLLKRGGFRVTYQTRRIRGEQYINTIGIKGKGSHPLMLCSHLDTVPAGNPRDWVKTNRNPWKASLRGDTLYGLGSADDKGPLLAMLAAGSQIPERALKRPLVVMGTFGEENGMGGATLFTRSWRQSKPSMAFAGEPTGLGITYRHKGIGVLDEQGDPLSQVESEKQPLN